MDNPKSKPCYTRVNFAAYTRKPNCNGICMDESILCDVRGEWTGCIKHKEADMSKYDESGVLKQECVDW